MEARRAFLLAFLAPTILTEAGCSKPTTTQPAIEKDTGNLMSPVTGSAIKEPLGHISRFLSASLNTRYDAELRVLLARLDKTATVYPDLFNVWSNKDALLKHPPSLRSTTHSWQTDYTITAKLHTKGKGIKDDRAITVDLTLPLYRRGPLFAAFVTYPISGVFTYESDRWKTAPVPYQPTPDYQKRIDEQVKRLSELGNLVFPNPPPIWSPWRSNNSLHSGTPEIVGVRGARTGTNKIYSYEHAIGFDRLVYLRCRQA